MKERVKRQALKQIFRGLTNLSDENLIKAIDLTERLFLKEDSKKATKTIKDAFRQKHPSVVLARRALGSLSKNSRNRLLENFFINAGILGKQRQSKLKKELGFGLPWFFVISPTAQCNLNCVGCYAWCYKREEGLSFEEVDRILKEAKELGIYFITISGGEPFVWPHLFRTLKKHKDMYFLIYTNGTLINKEVAKQLSQVGNAAPAISLEGFEKETDARRGAGIFKKAMEAMDNLREAGVLFGFSITPTKKNAEIISSDVFIDMLIEKGCSFGWFFQYVPIGKKPDVSLMASPEQRMRLREKVLHWRASKPIFIGDFWNDGPFTGGCIAAAREGGYFHINCNGDVEPCVFLQFSVDNIKGRRLIDVIQSPFFKAIQRAQPYCKNKNLLAPCALIDHPWALRHTVKTYGAKPSYNSSNDVIEDPGITVFLDSYSKALKQMTDPIWENELSGKYPHWKEKYGFSGHESSVKS